MKSLEEIKRDYAELSGCNLVHMSVRSTRYDNGEYDAVDEENLKKILDAISLW